VNYIFPNKRLLNKKLNIIHFIYPWFIFIFMLDFYIYLPLSWVFQLFRLHL